MAHKLRDKKPGGTKNNHNRPEAYVQRAYELSLKTLNQDRDHCPSADQNGAKEHPEIRSGNTKLDH